MIMKIIVPMAGRGSRLRPHTLTVPKPLIPVAGKPIVHRLVEDIAKILKEPIEEIAFIHDYDKLPKQEKLFEEVNDGKVRIIFGSTEKLGAGTNIQKRLKTLWHLDQPYRPRDITQREGRIT